MDVPVPNNETLSEKVMDMLTESPTLYVPSEVEAEMFVIVGTIPSTATPLVSLRELHDPNDGNIVVALLPD